EKLKRIFDPQTQAGYFPPKTEKAKDSIFPDMKEFYHFYKHLEPRSVTSDLAWALERLASSMLSAIDQELANRGVPVTTSVPLVRSVERSEKTLFRLLHYPPTNHFGLEAELMERAAPHE